MTSRDFRGESIRYTVVETFLGQMLIAATPQGIFRLHFSDDAEALVKALEAEFANASPVPPDDDFRALVEQTVSSLGTPETLDLPVDMRGTPFQTTVWQALREIPYGSSLSYGELARKIGKPTATRAVASACGRNEIAVLIPCHRVVGKNGSLTGYRWGVERKQRLLERERAEP